MLKVDTAFVAGLGRDPSCEAVVHAVLGIGQALGLAVVAEGVETAQQVELLRARGCTTAQGYLFGRPLPEADLLAHLGAEVVHLPEQVPARPHVLRPQRTA